MLQGFCGEGLERADRDGEGPVAVVFRGHLGRESWSVLPEEEVGGELYVVGNIRSILSDAVAQGGVFDSDVLHDDQARGRLLWCGGEVGSQCVGDQVGEGGSPERCQGIGLSLITHPGGEGICSGQCDPEAEVLMGFVGERLERSNCDGEGAITVVDTRSKFRRGRATTFPSEEVLGDFDAVGEVTDGIAAAEGELDAFASVTERVSRLPHAGDRKSCAVAQFEGAAVCDDEGKLTRGEAGDVPGDEIEIGAFRETQIGEAEGDWTDILRPAIFRWWPVFIL